CWFCRRGLSGQLAHAGLARRGAAVRFVSRRTDDNRCRRPRMGGLSRISADRQVSGAFSCAVAISNLRELMRELVLPQISPLPILHGCCRKCSLVLCFPKRLLLCRRS